jgi:hypothetical protein
MQLKLQTRTLQRVELAPGEEPIVAARAIVSKFSSSRMGAVLSRTVTRQAGGLGAALTSTRSRYLVLTNRRLVFLAQTFMGGPGRKVIGEVPRDQISLAEAKMGVASLLRIAFGNQGDGVALTFPRVDKKNAEAFAEGLGGAQREQTAR